MAEGPSENSRLLDSTNKEVVFEEPDYVELTGCGASLPCDPRRSLHRYLILILICFLSFGSYYCFDNPAALQDQMLNDLDLTEQQYMSFYSWYSWPNVVLCFFGGFFIDRFFGVRLGAIIFTAFVLGGQIIFAIGGYTNTYWVMCMGRFVFGVGGESLCVAQNTYTVKWFKGKELHLVFGLQLTFSRLGSTVNMNTMNPIYNMITRVFNLHGYHALGSSLFFGALFCLMSLVCALVLAYFDKRNDRVLQKGQFDSGEVIKLRDIKGFPLSVWLMCIICTGYYVAVLPFIALGKVFFEMKFDMSPPTANTVNSLIYIISAVASPIGGILVDNLGRNVTFMLIGILFSIGSHALLAFTFVTPYVAMILLGLAFSILASALWPLAAYMVPDYMLGTVYGVVQAVQNLGLASVALIGGSIVDSSGYLILEVFFLVCLCVSLIASVWMYLYDAAKNGSLNLTAKQRHAVHDHHEDSKHIEREIDDIGSINQ